MTDLPKIAVIGAGLAGISFAKNLTEFADISIFEKSRSTGGRMSLRRREPFSFDHGAQFFTARSEPFQAEISKALDAKAIAEWVPKIVKLELGEKPFKREWFEPHYCGTDGMNSLVKHMATGLNIVLETQVKRLESKSGVWFLIDEDEQAIGPFDWVVSAVPAPQAINLLPGSFVKKNKVGDGIFSGCFAMMLGFDSPVSLNFQAAVITDPVLAWLSTRDSSSLLIHSRNDWATDHINADLKWVESTMYDAVMALLPRVDSQPTHRDLHRWRYAKCEQALGQDYLLDGHGQIAAIGDWCRGGRVEDAFVSGYELAQKLKVELS
ncbi:MAG: putative NAD/FAD-dependent oxidoreductase [Pseudohongiellaceae bacterium]|jgi:renalase